MLSLKQHLLYRLEHVWGGHVLAFLIKQAWAALFGGLLLIGIILSHYIHLPVMARYDWLFLWAVIVQISMLVFRLERPREVVTILLFHLVGLGMELYKTSGAIGSWIYPETNVIRLAGVPLFSGFMYAAVGSYIARAWRVLNLRFTHYPRRIWTLALALLIYLNFFTHHYVWDLRLGLFAGLAVLYWRTSVSFMLIKHQHSMPLLVGFVLIAAVIWLAENVATYMNVWLYPDQAYGWHVVGIGKLGSWLLLMVISFVMIDCLHAVYRRRSLDATMHRD